MGKNGKKPESESTSPIVPMLSDSEPDMDEIEKKLFSDLPIEYGFDSMPMQQRLGVLQRLITAVDGSAQYLQLLLTGMFDNKKEALLAADAISERQRYGVDIMPIINRLTAQCGIRGERVLEVLRTMNSYTLHTNYQKKNAQWKREQDMKAL